MDCRGSPIPILDLRLRFRIEGKGEETRKTVIILELKQEEKTSLTGILVDKVQDVVEIEEEEISPPPEKAGNHPGNTLSGMVRADDGFLLLVSIDQVFGENTIDIIKEAETRLEA
jgi:purine-binding chemotaxis protein CheW